MATYDLKYPGAAIDAILDTAYDLQNAGYIFRGLASEYSNTPTERSWVLAGEGETGHGFTSPVPKGYIGVCVFNGTSWTGKLLKCVSIDSTPTNGSTNAVSSGGAYASISQLADTVNEALDNLTFTDSTPSAFLGEYITEKVSTTDGGLERILTYFTILAATTSKAGLLSAADKAKLDAILGNLRSLEIDDTTAYADLGTKIVESIKATIGGTEETISTFQILAATASKAGLLSAADKAKLDALWSSGYQFAGIATPSTTPISTTSKIFYIATEAGTYFNAVTITQGINILSWDGTTWSAVQVIGIDDEPTADSENLAKSGGVVSLVKPIDLLQKAQNADYIYNDDIIRGKAIVDGKIATDGLRGILILKLLPNCNNIASEYCSSYKFYSGVPDTAQATNYIGMTTDGTILEGAEYVINTYLLSSVDSHDITVVQSEVYAKKRDVDTIVGISDQQILTLNKDVEIIDNELFEYDEDTSVQPTDLSADLLYYANGINYRTGGTYTSSVYNHTGYVDISAYDGIVYGRAESNSPNTVMGIAFYDINKQYLGGVQAFIIEENGTPEKYIRTFAKKPLNAVYVRLSANVDTENWGEQYLFGCSVTKQRQDTNVLILNQDDICYDYSIASDGTAVIKDTAHTPNMGCTSFIPCEGADKITYRQVISRDGTAAGRGLAFYDANKELVSFIPGVYRSGSSGSRLIKVNVPTNAKFFRTTYFNRLRKDEFGGDFYARLESKKKIAYNGKRANVDDYVWFTVPVNQAIDAFWSTAVDAPQLPVSMMDTTGVLLLPASYTPDGKPTKLIINFHGYSHYVKYGEWGNGAAGFLIQKQRWAAAGYAVMDCNNWRYTLESNQSGLGSRQSMEAYRKCFEWVLHNYNIDPRPFIVCGSAGGPTGINCCYEWGDVRAAVWLDCWTTLAPDQNSYTACKKYYPELFGFDDQNVWEADKVVSYNPTGRVTVIGDTPYAPAPLCPVKVLWRSSEFAVNFYVALKNGGGRVSIRQVTGITHSDLVSGGDGTNPNSANIDAEIIAWLNGN